MNISIHPTLKAWIDDYCHENHLSFSQFLQDTFLEKFGLEERDLIADVLPNADQQKVKDFVKQRDNNVIPMTNVDSDEVSQEDELDEYGRPKYIRGMLAADYVAMIQKKAKEEGDYKPEV